MQRTDRDMLPQRCQTLHQNILVTVGFQSLFILYSVLRTNNKYRLAVNRARLNRNDRGKTENVEPIPLDISVLNSYCLCTYTFLVQ